jgi:hypothetical protein
MAWTDRPEIIKDKPKTQTKETNTIPFCHFFLTSIPIISLPPMDLDNRLRFRLDTTDFVVIHETVYLRLFVAKRTRRVLSDRKGFKLRFKRIVDQELTD